MLIKIMLEVDNYTLANQRYLTVMTDLKRTGQYTAVMNMIDLWSDNEVVRCIMVCLVLDTMKSVS